MALLTICSSTERVKIRYSWGDYGTWIYRHTISFTFHTVLACLTMQWLLQLYIRGRRASPLILTLDAWLGRYLFHSCGDDGRIQGWRWEDVLERLQSGETSGQCVWDWLTDQDQAEGVLLFFSFNSVPFTAQQAMHFWSMGSAVLTIVVAVPRTTNLGSEESAAKVSIKRNGSLNFSIVSLFLVLLFFFLGVCPNIFDLNLQIFPFHKFVDGSQCPEFHSSCK